MTRLPGKYKKGDRVVYTGNSPHFNQPHRIGETGTVITEYLTAWSEKPSVRVEWDSGVTFGHYPENIDHTVTTVDVVAEMRSTADDMMSQAAALVAGAYALTTLAELFDGVNA